MILELGNSPAELRLDIEGRHIGRKKMPRLSMDIILKKKNELREHGRLQVDLYCVHFEKRTRPLREVKRLVQINPANIC